MSLQVYPPIIVTNIIVNKFIPYRGYKILTENILNDDEIISAMERVGHLQINALNTRNPRGLRDKVIIVILKSNDNGGLELKRVKKVIEIIDNTEYSKSDTLDEVFLIVNKDFFDKKNFIDIVKELLLRQNGDLDVNGLSPFYTVCPYHNFAFDVPNCKIIYPHEIMTKDEITELLQSERITIKDLPTILSNDVPLIWNGARIGQVIRILRKSESALESIYYRKVEPYLR